MDCPLAANLLYKVIEVRYPRRSTALVTKVDFETWNDYLGDPPLAMFQPLQKPGFSEKAGLLGVARLVA